MIDADNEYPAEEIPEVVSPIWEGRADYTMGSRFKGDIRGMKLHRRIGNVCFTLLQCVLLRKVIWDGQSGMRGFSKEAMEQAEIIHDYNYAQVLTLNLVRQGFGWRKCRFTIRFGFMGNRLLNFASTCFPCFQRFGRKCGARQGTGSGRYIAARPCILPQRAQDGRVRRERGRRRILQIE